MPQLPPATRLQPAMPPRPAPGRRCSSCMAWGTAPGAGPNGGCRTLQQQDTNAVSLRGHGRSELGGGAPPGAAGTLSSHAEDLAAIVAALGAPPVLVCHSMGGLVAAQYVSQPGRPPLAALLAAAPPTDSAGTAKRMLWRAPLRVFRMAWCLLRRTYRTRPSAARFLFFSENLPEEDLQRYTARFAPAAAAAALPAQGRLDASTEVVQARAGQQPPAEVTLSRSQLMDKEVITRTSANRLGYVNQLFVDPGSLSVVSVYLRKAASSLSSLGESAADQDHMLLDSLQQVSDVVLVHDETALEAFPLDDTMGYCRLVGAEVVTEAGISLGKVRDYLFNPDTGAISTIKYDKLGVPSLPQALLSCYSISWEDVKALGPTRLVVYSGTELAAIKENDGIVDEGLALLVDIITGPEKKKDADGKGLAGAPQSAAVALGVGDDSRYRSDQAYYDWYVQHGAEYERSYGVKLDPPAGWVDPAYAAQQAQRAQQAQQAAAARRAAPALPPPQAPTFAQAVQPAQPAQQQGFQQQMFQQQRQAVPAGSAGADGWDAPPTAPPQQQQYAAPPTPQQQAPYPRQQQQQKAPPRGAPPQQPPRQQPAPARMQQPPAQQAPQQPLPPQNGIPIIDRTPLPPYRRRDADGNYGTAPPQQHKAPQQQRAPSAAAQQWQQPPASRAAPQPPSAPQQEQQQAQRQPPVVVPDAVIPGGSAGSSGGVTQVAEYRQI
ncbi:hypothetical protein ABPG75_010805 [Micractinium tetrahymenae]